MKTKLLIESIEYKDTKNISLKLMSNDYNGAGNFTITLDNIYGRYSDTFNLNDDVQIYADDLELTDPTEPTTRIFTGIIEDISFKAKGKRETVVLSGRDYSAIMQDVTVDSRIFKDTEASEIVKSIIIQNLSSEISLNNVNVTLTTIDKITFNNISVFDAISKVAEIAGYYFFVDDDKDLNFIEKDSVSSGVTIGNANIVPPVIHLKLDDNISSTDVVNSIETNDGTTTRNTLDMHNLIYHYKMNDNLDTTNVIDSSGQGNDGTSQVNTSTISTTGKINNALSFNGSSTNINIPTTKLQEMTISMWCNPDTIDTSSQTDYDAFIFSGAGGGDGRIYVFQDDNDLKIGLGNTATLLQINNIFEVDKWVHIVISLDGENYEVYIDNVLEASGTYSSDYSSTNWNIGSFSNSKNYFSGKIDDIRIYSKNINSNEVNLLNNLNQGTEETLVDGRTNNGLTFNGIVGGGETAHWTMNQGTGSYITDTQNSYIGSLTEGATFTDGIVNDCVLFNGSTSNVTCNEIGSLIGLSDNKEFTFATWFNTTGSGLSASGTEQILVGGRYGDNTTIGIGGTDAIECRTDDSAIFTANDIVGSNIWNHLVTTCSINTGSPYYPEWHIYLNNELVKTGSYLYATGDMPGPFSPGYIGFESRKSFGFNGMIDDTRFFDRILDDTERESLYKNKNNIEEEEDCLTLTNSIEVEPNNHTLTFWYKSSNAKFQMLFQQQNESTSGNIEFRPADNTILVESTTNNLWEITLNAEIDIDDGEWHHYSIIFGEDDTKLYVDNVLSDTKAASTDTVDFRYKCVGGHGNYDYTYGQNPDGTFDDIRVYDYTITEKALTGIFNKTLGTEDAILSEESNVTSSSFRTADHEIFNKVTVFGDRQLTGAREFFTRDTGSILNLDAKPYNVSLFLSGVPNVQIQPGGILNISNPETDTAKFLVDFNSSSITLVSGLTAGDIAIPVGSIAIVDYQRSTPLIKIKSDATSIAEYGTKQRTITDRNIKDNLEANTIALTYLNEHKDPKTEGTLQVKNVLLTTPGHTVVVNLPNEGQTNQTYSILELDYEFNTINNASDRYLSISLNKKVTNFVDIMKEEMLRLRRLEAADVETSITNFSLAGDTVGVTSSARVVYLPIGSGFFFGVNNHNQLNSPTSLLGPIVAGSTVIDI